MEIIYLQPEASTDDRCIDFETFAKYVERSSDPLSKHFATHLRLWRAPAGSREPPDQVSSVGSVAASGGRSVTF